MKLPETVWFIWNSWKDKYMEQDKDRMLCDWNGPIDEFYTTESAAREDLRRYRENAPEDKYILYKCEVVK